MIVKPSHLRPIPSFLLPFIQAPGAAHARWLHQPTLPRSSINDQTNRSVIPRPTPFVPDVQTFLTLIGRNLSQHASKIPSWKALFSLKSEQLKELGIEPPRSRRYLLQWRERFRQGQFGPGGNLKFVQNGVATLQIVENPGLDTTQQPGGLKPGQKKVFNVPTKVEGPEIPSDKLAPAAPFKIKRGSTIVGPYVQQVGKRVAKIEVKEGLWEHRRGHKIDGGERRQAEVRAKRRAEERSAR